MIGMFQLIGHYTPDAYWFDIDVLMPGIIVFAFAFVMLYMAILVSNDRTTSLLSRLYSSPMKTSDYIIGYGVPGIILGYLQIIICVIVSYIIAAATGVNLSFGGVLLNFAVDLPVIVVMTAIGILFGSILSDKSAPGVSSAIITISAVLGGAWMPLETMGSLETGMQIPAVVSCNLYGQNGSIGRIRRLLDVPCYGYCICRGNFSACGDCI